MAELVKAGKVRHLGLSEAAPATIGRAADVGSGGLADRWGGGKVVEMSDLRCATAVSAVAATPTRLTQSWHTPKAGAVPLAESDLAGRDSWLGQQLFQGVELDGLRHVVIEARLPGAAAVVLLPPAGQGDQHDVASPL